MNIYICKKTLKQMFIAFGFLISKPKTNPNVCEYVKRWYIHTVEHYSAIKKALLTHTTTWMKLRIIKVGSRCKAKGNALIVYRHTLEILWISFYTIAKYCNKASHVQF